MSSAPGTKGILAVGVLAAVVGLGVAIAIGRGSRAATLDSEDAQRAAAMIADAVKAYEHGDSDKAIRSAEKAAALRPSDPQIAELLDRWRRESSVHSSYLEKSAEHFRILYEGGAQQSIGDRVSRVLEREYTRIGGALGSYPSETLTVILYTDREFRDITRSPSWATANFDGRIRVNVGGALTPSALDRVVTHELVHAIVATVARRRLPSWLNEGLATYLEGSNLSWTTDALRRAGTIVPLDGLASGFSDMDEQAALVAYAESATAAEILCGQLGPNIGAFLRTVGDGRSIDDALLEFQVQPNAFHSEWRRRVGLR